MLARKSGKKLNAAVSDYVLFDLETTGTSCATDAVIEMRGVWLLGALIVICLLILLPIRFLTKIPCYL